MASKRLPSKGERLGWTPIDQVKNVVITLDFIKGIKLKSSHSKVEAGSAASSYLIP